MSTDPGSRSKDRSLDPTDWHALRQLPESALLRLDPAGRIIDANLALCTVLGMTREVLKGTPLAAISAWRMHERASQQVRFLLRAGYLRYGDLPLAGADGTPRQFSYQRIRCMEDDSQIIECRHPPERARASDSRRAIFEDGRRGILDGLGIEAAVRLECARTRASGKPLSILRLDVDRVRLDVGAPMLLPAAKAAASRRFAGRLLGFVRNGDIVGQLDQHAYVILLPATPARSAVRAAERLRTAIAASEGGASVRGATVSIGIVTTRTGRAPYRTLRARADAKCEEASSSGGNRVIP